VPYTVVQFVTLQQVNLAARRLQVTETRAAPLISYASGAVAGMAATCISYPFDLLRTTLAAQGEPKVGTLSSAARLLGHDLLSRRLAVPMAASPASCHACGVICGGK
jgi:solute carrier family 25 (mitochondrial thiamine pyrophosphate transporter), member 19